MNVAKCEYKFLLPVERVDALREALLPHVSLDPFAEKRGRGEYTVRSVYLDTPDMAAYREKIEGVRERRKYRIRVYNEYDPLASAFLEIKKKEASRVSKYRAKLPLADVDDLFGEGETIDLEARYHGNGTDPRRVAFFLQRCRVLRLQPKVLVIYEREPFHGILQPSLRITIDKNLRGAPAPAASAFFEEGAAFTAMRRYSTLEVKFVAGMPLWLREILNRFALQRRALSKYILCYDAISRTAGGLRAALPAQSGSGASAMRSVRFPSF